MIVKHYIMELAIQIATVSNDCDDMSKEQVLRLQFFVNKYPELNEQDQRIGYYYFNALRRNARDGKINRKIKGRWVKWDKIKLKP